MIKFIIVLIVFYVIIEHGDEAVKTMKMHKLKRMRKRYYREMKKLNQEFDDFMK